MYFHIKSSPHNDFIIDYIKYFFEDSKIIHEDNIQTIKGIEYIWEYAVVPNDTFEQVPISEEVAQAVAETKKGVEIDEDGDGVMDGLDFDGDGVIDEYFAHRQCEHVWGDLDGDGTEECLKCGKIKMI